MTSNQHSFNPLFIGACLRTAKFCAVKAMISECFNPLFIGACLRTTRSTMRGGCLGVSIPSSSGHVFGLAGTLNTVKIVGYSFNPLFIG